jgi:hypothetical protein
MKIQPGKLLKSSFGVALATFASRICGLLRVRLESAVLGGGALASGWFLAVTIPNLFRRLLGEGALGTALIPLMAEIEEKDGIPTARRKLAVVFTVLGIILALIVLILSLAAVVTGKYCGYFSNDFWRSDRITIMLKLLPLLMPYAFFICLTGVIGSVLNYAKIFVRPALTALLFNIFMLAGLSIAFFGGFSAEKILPFLKDGACVWIGIPGVQEAYAGRSEELLNAWLGDEAYMFRSASQWKEIIGTHERILTAETWEMDCFDKAWEEWFQTGSPYANGDKEHFESLIKPYTCFVGIHIRLK